MVLKEKFNIFILAIGSLIADFILKLSETVNLFYATFIYSQSEISTSTTSQEGTITVYHSLWPAYIIGLAEILLIYLTFKYLVRVVKIE